jgi:hypothetical protein
VTITNTNEPIVERRRVEMRALGSGRVWCARCEKHVSAVTVEQAAALVDLTAEVLSEGIGNRRLHIGKRLNGDFLICLESLIKFSRSGSMGRPPSDRPYLRMR